MIFNSKNLLLFSCVLSNYPRFGQWELPQSVFCVFLTCTHHSLSTSLLSSTTGCPRLSSYFCCPSSESTTSLKKNLWFFLVEKIGLKQRSGYQVCSLLLELRNPHLSINLLSIYHLSITASPVIAPKDPHLLVFTSLCNSLPSSVNLTQCLTSNKQDVAKVMLCHVRVQVYKKNPRTSIFEHSLLFSHSLILRAAALP